MARLEVNIGDKYGRLTIIEEVEPHIYPSGDKRRKFLCKCDCGSEPKSYMINGLRSGQTASCGCLNLERITKHGRNDTREYQIWADMKTRCDCENNKFYPDYGGRGISYEDKWKSFEGFWEDMEEGYGVNLTLDRVDVNASYSKANCRWATVSQQNHNRRKKANTNSEYIGVLYNGYSYIARLKQNGVCYNLGSYDDENRAVEAYDNGSEILFGIRPNGSLSLDKNLMENVDSFIKRKQNGETLRLRGEFNKSAKLKEEEVLEIKRLLQEGLMTQKEIAKLFGVGQFTISAIKRGKIWKDVNQLLTSPQNAL